jgi:ATP-dependent Clp protease ATP-binding subunit ClpC
VWNSLLQILDDGRLTDGQGRIVDFRNTVLIMTSNLGTEYVLSSGPIGFVQTSNIKEREAQEKIQKELKKTFRPEFLNRIDEIITFSALTLEQMSLIVDLQMGEVKERLSEHGVRVQLTPTARDWLAEIGYDPDFGARPLRRALQKHVESPLSVKILSSEFKSGNLVIVDVVEKDGEQVLEFSQPDESNALVTEEVIDA